MRRRITKRTTKQTTKRSTKRSMKLLWLALTLAVASLLGGCLSDPQIGEMVEAIEWDLQPARLAPQTELRLGRGLIGLARTVLSWADEEEADEVNLILGDLDAIHIGVYEVEGVGWDEDLELSGGWQDDLLDLGWQTVVRVKDGGGEIEYVLAKMDAGELTGLYVVSLEDRELVVVKLEGELSRSLEHAVRRDEEFFTAVRDVADQS